MKLHHWTLLILAADGVVASGKVIIFESTQPASPPPPTASAATKPSAAHWLDSIDSGYLQSQQTGRPMLVFVCGDWVAASRREWVGLQSKELSQTLADWTLVRLSPDRSTARSLGIVTVPAIRLLSADGKVVAGRNDVMSADQLRDWLEAQKRNLPSAPAILDVADTPSLDTLVARLGDADTTVREAAIRQLRSNAAAHGSVVELLTSTSLARRISAADLLEQWGAPLTGIDPWTPSTITPDRLVSLRAWAAENTQAGAISSTQPSADLSLASDELDALVNAPSEAAARAVRERLVRFGEPLLQPIHERLNKNPPEPARQRLLALQYRLVASDRLAIQWPGGFDLLASTDPAVRRAATAELASRAQPEDHRLLRELFTADDPFVREQSLRMLRSVGGPETGAALIELLRDPEPNVRAAVLKTLSDSPDASLAPGLVQYVASETDTDLIVHAVHVLQVTPGPQAFECLKGLLTHPQWRVRGEAAEAMLGKLSGNETSGLTDEEKAEAYEALIKRLDDEDGYVVNRAAFSLIKSNFAMAAAPLMNAAQRRPELARDVLTALANEPDIGKTLLPQIRAMTSSGRAQVRVAAVVAMAQLAPQTCGSVIKAALADSDRSVRVAAVRAAADALDQLLPRTGRVTHSSWFGLSETTEQIDISNWVTAFRKGTDRPPWISDIGDFLVKDLVDPDTRGPAAVVLSALGRESQAWPVLSAAVNHPAERNDAAKALCWLPWERRVELFKSLMAAAGGGEVSQIMEAFVTVPDVRAAGPVWDLLGPKAKDADLAPVHDALRKLYLGDEYYNISAISPERLDVVVQAAKDKAKGGTDLQRIAALSLLLTAAPSIAAVSARHVYADSHNDESLRLDALKVLLLAEADDAATATAIAAMEEKPMRDVAISFLAAGEEAVGEAHGTLNLYSTTVHSSDSFFGLGQPVIITPPTGLKIEPLREVLKDAGDEQNGDVAAYAGYLMVLLGDKSGLGPLLQGAQSHDMDGVWPKLVYRAIAKCNDDSQTAILEQIFRGYMKNNNWEIREMYWTIRSMTGPNILKLRKTIRDEYGMDKLR